MAESTYQIAPLTGLSPEESAWVAAHSKELHLQPGEYLFHEGDNDDRFYLVLEGELLITHSFNGVEQVLGKTERGEMGGELALLKGAPRSGSARALVPSRLLIFDRLAFQGIFAAVPTLGMRILSTAAKRLSGNASRVTHEEKLAALGKFSAGLAHELNNPAAAAQRATQTLNDALPSLLERSAKLCLLGLEADQLERLQTIARQVTATINDRPPLSAIERSDREDALMGWLERLGGADAFEDTYEIASAFVTSGLTDDDLRRLLDEFPAQAAAGILEWLSGTLNAHLLLCEIDDSATRISEMVQAIKEYTYMDQGKLQEVDIHRSLETTLKVLGHKLRGIRIERDYDETPPRIIANGSELNQVWTNLIDNAIDAVRGVDNPTITLTTRAESHFVMVAVGDNGTGIPPAVQPRVFEPFFTTKDVGEGTGLGLDITHRIVTQHEGTITVESRPGDTRFIVRLPIEHTYETEPAKRT